MNSRPISHEYVIYIGDPLFFLFCSYSLGLLMNQQLYYPIACGLKLNKKPETHVHHELLGFRWQILDCSFSHRYPSPQMFLYFYREGKHYVDLGKSIQWVNFGNKSTLEISQLWKSVSKNLESFSRCFCSQLGQTRQSMLEWSHQYKGDAWLYQHI